MERNGTGRRIGKVYRVLEGAAFIGTLLSFVMRGAFVRKAKLSDFVLRLGIFMSEIWHLERKGTGGNNWILGMDGWCIMAWICHCNRISLGRAGRRPIWRWIYPFLFYQS